MMTRLLVMVLPSLIVLLLSIHQSWGLTVEKTCAIVKNNSFIADPSDCQGWVYCLNGKPYHGKCDSGLLYDPSRGVCDYPDKTTCSANVTTMCRRLSGVYKVNPFSCSEYCYCQNGETNCTACPPGQYFNYTTTQCVWSDSSTCIDSTPCALVPDGFVQDTRGCDTWFRCAKGLVVASGKCKNNLLYNPATASCDYAETVNCKSKPTSPPPDVHNPPKGACSATNKPNDGNDEFFVADPNSCRGYFWCKSTGEKNPLWGQCPKNAFFDPDTRQCTDTIAVACWQRCDRTSSKFMTLANSNCTEYIRCDNGKQVGSGACPPGYYFLEPSEACYKTDEKPSYPICNVVLKTPE